MDSYVDKKMEFRKNRDVSKEISVSLKIRNINNKKLKLMIPGKVFDSTANISSF
jgi:hypothetical protein